MKKRPAKAFKIYSIYKFYSNKQTHVNVYYEIFYLKESPVVT